jgi:hypothetical protein
MHMLYIIMDVRPDIAEIETELRARGQSVAQLCRIAGLNQTTWVRWKSGTEARADSWDRAISAFKQMTAEPLAAQAA